MTNEELLKKIGEWYRGSKDSLHHEYLHDYLGWTLEEYNYWVETGEMPNA